MQNIKLTIKNYRCFSDEAPLTVDLREGLTALIGPNNSGKSTFLRFFYEMRKNWQHLTNRDSYIKAVVGTRFGNQYEGVEDPTEVFFNGNSRPISIEIELPSVDDHSLSKLHLKAIPNDPTNWYLEMYLGPNLEQVIGTEPLQAGDSEYTVRLRTNRGVNPVDLGKLIEIMEIWSRCIYIGAFRNAIGEGTGRYFDLPIGTEFISMWNQWKTGADRTSNVAAQRVSEDIGRIFSYNRLEINATDKNPKTIQVVVDGKPFRLRELGSGLTQFIVVFGYVAMNKPSLLLVDEPELNLHPSLQIDFLTSLASYASHGAIFATHSLGLARSVGERIYSFRQDGSKSIVKPFEQTTSLSEFLGQMSYTSYRELGHKWVLLVEGVTDVLSTQQYLRLLHLDHEVVVLSLGGSTYINGRHETELSELQRMQVPVAVLIDSERPSESHELPADRRAFVDICKRLGFRVHVTTLRASDNYLSSRAIKEVMGNDYTSLLPYQRLEDVSPRWKKSQSWRIARAMTRDELLGTDIGQFLRSLTESTNS